MVLSLLPLPICPLDPSTPPFISLYLAIITSQLPLKTLSNLLPPLSPNDILYDIGKYQNLQ